MQGQMLDVVARNTQRLRDLIEDVLIISRVESGTLRMERMPVALRGVIDHAVTALYSGDVHFRPELTGIDQSVSKVATTTTLSLSAPVTTYGDNLRLTARVAPADGDLGVPTGTVTFFADGPEGRTTVTAFEQSIGPTIAQSGTVTLTLRAGYAFGLSPFDVGSAALDGTIKVTTLATTPSHHVSVSAPAGATLSSKGAVVAGGARPGFLVTAPDGVALPAIPGGTCPPGSWDGKRYTAGAITSDCTSIP